MDEILDLIESVCEGFPTYFSLQVLCCNMTASNIHACGFKSVPGGVVGVAHFITGHEQTQ